MRASFFCVDKDIDNGRVNDRIYPIEPRGKKRMRISGSGLSIAVCLSYIFISSGISHAQLTNKELPDRTGLKLSSYNNARAHAAFKTEERIDTNIFLANTDRKLDSITILEPSIGLDLPLGENSLSADYDVGIYLYGKYTDQGHVDQKARALAEFNLSDYKVTPKDTFRIFTDRASNESSQRIKQEINNFRTGIEAQFEKLIFDAGYTNLWEAYESDQAFYGPLTYEDKDRFSNIIDITASYRVLPKTYLLIENDLGFVHYYNSSEVPGSWYDETVAGIKGEWFSKSDVNFRAGLRYQHYDSSDLLAYKAYTGAVMRGGFNYYPTEDDTIALSLERSIYESTYSNMNYYTLNAVGLDYKHKFNDKISFKLFGSYQFHQYPSETTENGVTAKRYDNYCSGGASLRYDIRKWISVEVRQEYTQKASKFDIFDYVDNVTSVKGTIGF